MPGLNILSVAPMTAGDSSVAASAPTSAPPQSFAQVQQQVSDQMQSPVVPDPGGAASSPSMPKPDQTGSDQGRQKAEDSKNAAADGSDHRASGSNDQAGTAKQKSHAERQADSGDNGDRRAASNQNDARQVDHKSAAKDKGKTKDATDKGKQRKSDDKVTDPNLTPEQLLAIAQHQSAGHKVVSPGKLSAKGEGRHAVSAADTETAGRKGSAKSADKKVADELDKALQKALKNGVQSGKGKTGREIAADKGSETGLMPQTRLQGFGGEGGSFHQILTKAAPGTAQSAQSVQTAQAGQSGGTPGLSQYSTSVDLPVQHARWGEQIAGKVTWLANQHIQVADIHVNPPDLGPVHVQMHLHNDQASVTMHSHHPGVRDLLESNGQRLKDMMQQGGLNLANFDVSSQSGQQQGQGQQHSSEGAGRGSPTASRTGSSLEKEPVRAGSISLGWSRLDLYA